MISTKNEAACGAPRSDAGLAAGDRIALEWGSSVCTAKVLAADEGRYFLEMDWGGKEMMDTAKLLRRKYVRLSPNKLSFWRRILCGRLSPVRCGPGDTNGR